VAIPDSNAAADQPTDVLTPPEIRQEVAASLLMDILQERRMERRWKRIRRITTGVLVLGGVLLYLASYAGLLGYRMLPMREAVAVVPITGEIAMGTQASADAVNPVLERLFESDKVKGIVLLINSGGGSPSEAERITNLLDEMRAKTKKPVYAACSGMCASAAYLIAIHTDRIYVGDYTWTGSIGAIMKGWDFRAVIEKLRVDQRVFASGSMKDLMNPFKPLSPEMSSKLDGLVRTTANTFIRDVKARRAGKLIDDASLFTGEVWTGADAVRLGLADEIATLEGVLAQQFAGLPSATYEPKRRRNSFFESVLSEIGTALTAVLREETAYEVSL
jgi:protease-4